MSCMYFLLPLLQSARVQKITPNPNATPIPNPIHMNSKSISPTPSKPKLLKVDGGVATVASHFVDNGSPHKPMFPRNELLVNVRNCWLCGIFPWRRFCERFKTARNVSFVNCQGIFPDHLFLERSNDSSCVKFSKDVGIEPSKPFCEKLSTWSNLRLHIDFGICP